MEKKISYLAKTFNDFREEFITLFKQYYPDVAESMNDASIGSYIMDLIASASDNLGYYIDRMYQETTIDGAQEESSLYNIARTNGVKIPGRKGAMTEVEISCNLPLVNSTNPNSGAQQRHPNWTYAPVIKKGTKFAAGDQIFELDHDVNFGHQFDDDAFSNRTYRPLEDNNGITTAYRVTKTATVSAGETRIYKREITADDIKPFLEITLPFKDIMGIESIIFKEGDSFQTDPSFAEFLVKNEYTKPENSPSGKEIYRFFEVDNLVEQYRWDDVTDGVGKPVKYYYGYKYNSVAIPTMAICKGEWKPVRQKFMTEFTDNGYLKIVFGAGNEYGDENVDLGNAKEFTKYLISKMINNDGLGVLPKPGMTMFVLYRTGGGAASNVGIGALNTVTNLIATIGECYDPSTMDSATIASVRRSISVYNPIPSVSGRDRLDPSEIKNFIKYTNGAKDRCVTVKDYHSRILQMPYKYGSAYRVGVTEENNKVMVYLLGIDETGDLTTVLPSQYVKNLSNYLSEYRMINDFVEMKSGKIINLSFEVDLHIDKAYNPSDVVSTVITKIKDYMDIKNHQMGDEIFLGDLKKEISLLDGVINLIDLRVYNEFNGNDGYSTTQTTQQIMGEGDCTGTASLTTETGMMSRAQIDLEASDYVLYSENDTMLEIKYPDSKDIRVRCKAR